MLPVTRVGIYENVQKHSLPDCLKMLPESSKINSYIFRNAEHTGLPSKSPFGYCSSLKPINKKNEVEAVVAYISRLPFACCKDITGYQIKIRQDTRCVFDDT